MKFFLVIVLSIGCFCYSAYSQVAKPATKPSVKPAAKPIVKPVTASAKLTNGIKLTATGGVIVEKASLQFEDGTAVPSDNMVELNQKIYLVIEIKDGWIPIDNNIQIGASEKILSSDGRKILSVDDLFKDLKTISIEDSKYITLKAVITSQDKVIPFFTVQFEIWDKQGKGKIKGSYKFKTNWKPE